MTAERIEVLEYELKAVRALRSSRRLPLVLEAMGREKELVLELERLRGAGARPRDPSPSEGDGKHRPSS